MVLIVGECRHATVIIGFNVVDLPYFAMMCFVRPLYIIPSRP
jgi:hypothetical protein